MLRLLSYSDDIWRLCLRLGLSAMRYARSLRWLPHFLPQAAQPTNILFCVVSQEGHQRPDTTPIVPTPTQNSELSQEEPQDAVRHEANKPTPSVPTQSCEFFSDEPRNVIRNDFGTPALSVATSSFRRRHRIANIATLSLGKLYETTLASRRGAS